MATKQRSFTNTEKTDFRQEFTDKVLAAIESGQKLPWEKPWVSGMSMAPSNAVTGNAYNGVNRLILGARMLENGYTDPRFLTFKQALALDGGVNKGEKGVQLERWDTKPFWKRPDVEILMGSMPVSVGSASAAGVHLTNGRTVAPEQLRVAVAHEQRTYSWEQADRNLNVPVGLVFTVFNVEQCRDLKLEPLPAREPVAPEARLLHIQQAMTEQTGLQFANGPAALYSPGRDTVVTPKPEMFKSLGDYQSTMLHEIGHATGAETRLNRPTLTEPAKFGSATYAKEELRAELFSAFAAMETGITRTRDEQHHAYLQSWAETIKKDKNELFRAARDAAEAVDYVRSQEQAFDLKADRVLNVNAVSAPEPAKPVEIDRASGLARIEDAGRLTGKLMSVEPTPDPQRDLVHVRRAGVDVAVSVPSGAVSRDLESGTPIKMHYEPKAGLQVEAGLQPSRGKSAER